MLNKIVLDLETQKDFSEVGGRNKNHLLRVSVAGIYSYVDDKFICYHESELHKLGEILAGADQIIGFNVKQFDFAVLQPYLNFSLAEIPTLDILQEIEQVLGHRISLDTVAKATIGASKTGSGLAALALWRKGQLEELKQYCLNDVRLTRDVYEFGQKHDKLLYQDFFDVREIPVRFEQPKPRVNVIRQTSLF
ncbi:MAG: ribonuclease H-like domain-containing protein [bacterium]|nr:ribonuclease H-like domain-containing protein [bacterium]